MLSATLFVYHFDAVNGPEGKGLDLFNSLYFAYISITTVGFGDVMPVNVTVSSSGFSLSPYLIIRKSSA